MRVTEEWYKKALEGGATVNNQLSVDKADGSVAVRGKQTVPFAHQTPPVTLERPALRKGVPAPLEHDEQASLFRHVGEWAELYPLLQLLFAVPNGAKLPYTTNAKGQRYSKQAKVLLEEGLKPGVPDMLLPVPSKGKHGLFLEMKRADRSNHPSDEQNWWINQLRLVGYECVVCYGASEAWEVIKTYMGIDEDLATRDAGHREPRR